MENGTPFNSPELFTVPQIVEKTGLSKSKVYELIRSTELPSVKVHGSRRIRRKDFEAWVDALGDAGA